MTPKLCSVHNHATLCDGRDTPEAMAAAAFTQGIRRVSAVAEGGVVMDGAELRRHCIRSCLTL